VFFGKDIDKILVHQILIWISKNSMLCLVSSIEKIMLFIKKKFKTFVEYKELSGFLDGSTP
jgi:hypothetical protein